jgi:hypothetical protein
LHGFGRFAGLPSEDLHGVIYLIVLGFTAAGIAAVLFFCEESNAGKAFRAIRKDLLLAQSQGINAGLRHPGSRPDRGRRLRRPTAIRSGYGRHLSPAPGQRSAGGRYAYTARPDRRARRVRQRRPGVDGQHYTHLDKGPGQVLDRFLPATTASLASAAQ